MTTHICNQVSKAYQATPLWTEDTPADAAAGLASAAWAPVAAEIARHTGPTAPSASKRAAYTQVVAELRRTSRAVSTSKKLGPSERLSFGGFVQVLLNHYEQLLADA